MTRIAILVIAVVLLIGAPAIAFCDTVTTGLRALPDLAFHVFGVALASQFLFNTDVVPIVGDRSNYFYQAIAAGGSLSYASSAILPMFWRRDVKTLRRTQRIVDAASIVGVGLYAVASPHYDGDDGFLLAVWVAAPAMLHFLSTFIPSPAH